MAGALAGAVQASNSGDAGLTEIRFHEDNQFWLEGVTFRSRNREKVATCCDYEALKDQVKYHVINLKSTLDSEGKPWSLLGKFKLPIDSVYFKKGLEKKGSLFICKGCLCAVTHQLVYAKFYKTKDAGVECVADSKKIIQMKNANFEEGAVFKIQRFEGDKEEDGGCPYRVLVIKLLSPVRYYLPFMMKATASAKQKGIGDKHFVAELELMCIGIADIHDKNPRRTYVMVNKYGKHLPDSFKHEYLGVKYERLSSLRAETKYIMVNARNILYKDPGDELIELCYSLCDTKYFQEEEPSRREAARKI